MIVFSWIVQRFFNEAIAVSKIKHAGDAMGMTGIGGMMGTPGYMAPEQWGDAGRADGRADVYAFGCIAFEMCCGRPPFVVSSLPEAYFKHVHEVPSARPRRRWRHSGSYCSVSRCSGAYSSPCDA